MKRFYMLTLLVLMGIGNALAASVKVTMNSTSTTMTLVNKTTGASVDVGSPTSNAYTFETVAGTYVLTAYDTDGTTVNGTIELVVTDDTEEQGFTVFTNTVYATNSGWTVDTDYTVTARVCSREGVRQTITVGNSKTAGRKTFLALNGNSYYVAMIPSDTRKAEGYMTLYKAGTLTSGVTVSGAIPMGDDYSITVPSDATLQLGIKFSHYVDYTIIEPESVTMDGSNKQYNYRLAASQVYNYRTWKSGGLTQGGYFTMNSDATKRPTLAFTEADYTAFDPATIKHDVKWNGGYETGDIFVNINERGHLTMNVNDTLDAHALRSWQLTDNSTNNYFIEPDFHYTVINTDGTPSTGVIQIQETEGSPWATLKAVGNGTVIVLVTYDAIGLNCYSSGKTEKTAYMGGEYWSAIWPENTAAYVVTVGGGSTSIDPNMTINEAYNSDTKKNAGKYVDAEHDVFYYLDTEEGYSYTFTPSGVSSVTMAYPTIGARMATYSGFGTTGVTDNGDGSYTLLLKEGRQIVRLSDASGNCVYQVLTAKTCHRDVTNATRPGSQIFQRGDQVKIQYSGLRHPANKMSGIYNMSAYVTYNGTPNGTSLILGSGQYTFGSAASAQAVSVTIPSDYEGTVLKLDSGVIQVNGYGDPIGNHRYILRASGRNANFTAVAHKTYFGAIPDVEIPVSDTRNIMASVSVTPASASLTLTDASGNALTPDANGYYAVTLGNYYYTAKNNGYKVLRGTMNVPDDATDTVSCSLVLTATPAGAWDGTTMTEPSTDAEGYYLISNAAELAWFANNVNTTKVYTACGRLTADIDLAGYDWTPIGGTSSSTAFKGTFDGQNHTVTGIYVNTTATYKGFFGYTSGTVQNVTLEGDVISTANYASGAVGYANVATLKGITNRVNVTGKMYVAGITSYAYGATTIDSCVNEATITGTGNYVAGITARAYNATTVVSNCLNTGAITGGAYVSTLVSDVYNNSTVVTNCLALGTLECTGSNTGNVYSGITTTRTGITNNYVSTGYTCGAQYETIVSIEQLASGEVAYKLGDAWGQQIGFDEHPVLGGMKVYYDSLTDTYTNDDPSLDYTLAVLTFEDEDYKGGTNFAGGTNWTSLIDDPQYGGTFLYGSDGMGVDSEEKAYYWTDENNTWLHNILSEGYGTWCYWSGGHAISNYGSGDQVTYGDYTSQLTVYHQGVDGLTQTGNGHNGSDNFAVHYGYSDDSGYGLGEEALPALSFADGVARVIDHMYVTNTCYAVNCYIDGNSLTASISDDDWVKIVATGYNEDTMTDTAEIYLCNGPENIVMDWTKFDLSRLGEVTRVTFNVTGSSDNGYGFSQPAYFAYDDVAVRMPKGSRDPNVDGKISISDIPTAIRNKTDVTGDGKFTTADVELLVKYLLKK